MSWLGIFVFPQVRVATLSPISFGIAWLLFSGVNKIPSGYFQSILTLDGVFLGLSLFILSLPFAEKIPEFMRKSEIHWKFGLPLQDWIYSVIAFLTSIIFSIRGLLVLPVDATTLGIFATTFALFGTFHLVWSILIQFKTSADARFESQFEDNY